MAWIAVGKVGKVIEERTASGRTRIRIDFGRRRGKRIRLDSIPNPTDGQPIPLADRATAERVLESVRGVMADGCSLEQALAPFRGTTAPEDMIEARLKEYIGHFREKVAQGKRSPNSLRELERYAKKDGHFSAWYGRSIHGITYGEIEDWQLSLGKRISPLTGQPISPKTQKNVSDAFRAFLRWLRRRGTVMAVPEFPSIDVPEYAPETVDMEQQTAILEAIPWERRGAFLVAASEAVRVGEVRAFNLDDYRDGKLRVSKATQGPRLDAPVRHTKNRSAEWRELWHPELIRWIEWRLTQATPEARLRGEVALFWNPTARNREKRWNPASMERDWHRACEKVGVSVSLQEGTRHTTLTALGATLPERMLRAFSRHRDSRSLDRYSKPRPTPAAIVRALPKRPKVAPGWPLEGEGPEKGPLDSDTYGGADGTRTRPRPR
jgi:hypothetical protein